MQFWGHCRGPQRSAGTHTAATIPPIEKAHAPSSMHTRGHVVWDTGHRRHRSLGQAGPNVLVFWVPNYRCCFFLQFFLRMLFCECQFCEGRAAENRYFFVFFFEHNTLCRQLPPSLPCNSHAKVPNQYGPYAYCSLGKAVDAQVRTKKIARSAGARNGSVMHQYPQNQSYVVSSGQTLTTNVSMTLCSWQICHQTHVLCGRTTFVPNQMRYQINTVPPSAVAWTRA